MQSRNYRPERTLKIDGMKPGDRVELDNGKFGHIVDQDGPMYAYVRLMGQGRKVVRLHYQRFWLAPCARAIKKQCRFFREQDPRPPFSRVDDEQPWMPPVYLGLEFDEIAETATCESHVEGELVEAV